MLGILPSQSVTETEKYKDGKKWFKQTADYYIRQNVYYDYKEIDKLYNAIDGIIDPEYYKHIHNPYNSSSDKWNNLPAKLKYFNIIEPVVLSIVGGKASEPNLIRLSANNPDMETEYTESLNKKILSAVYSEARMRANEMMGVKDEQEKPYPKYSEIETNHKLSFRSRRTINLSNAWDYISQKLQYKDLSVQMLYDFLVVGICTSHNYVYRDEVYKEVIHPREITVYSDYNTFLIEDAVAVCRKRPTTLTYVIDRFRGIIDEPMLKRMEQDIHFYSLDSSAQMNLIHNRPNTGSNNPVVYAHQGMLYHVQWKAQREIKVLTYKNNLGVIMETEVSPEYMLNSEEGDISLKSEFIDWAYEAYRYGEQEWLYVGELKNQRHELSNTSNCKLEYTGYVNRNRSGFISSIVKTGMAYQALYNTYKFRMEMIMAVNKDKIMLLPKGLKPKNWSWDEWMYNISVTRIAFIDETNEKIATLVQAIKDIDLSLGNYIGEMIKITEQIKQDWWDSVGFNRQRLGDIMASDGKGTTGEALYRSSLITAEYIRKYALFERTDVASLLDYSKYAWRKGKTAQFLNTEGRETMLKLEGDDWKETSYNIFVKNAQSEVEKSENLKSLLQPMAQNDMSKGLIAEILDETDFEKIKQLMYKADEIQKSFIEEQSRLANEATKEAGNKVLEAAQIDSDTKRYIADSGKEATIEAAKINAMSKLLLGTTKDGDGDGLLNEAANQISSIPVAEGLENSIQQYLLNQSKVAVEAQKQRTAKIKASEPAKTSK